MVGALVVLVVAQLSADALQGQVAGAWAQTPRAQAAQASLAAVHQRVTAAMTDTPLGASASVGATQFQRRRAADLLSLGRPLWSLSPQAQLGWKDRSGLAATLTGSVPWSLPEAALTPMPNQLPFQVSLDVSYDVLNGGRQGLAWSRAGADAAALVVSLHQLRASLLDDRLALVRQFNQFIVSTCKLRVLRSARPEIQAAVADGKLRYQTKVLAYKDLLNFQDLENNFRRQLTQLEADQAILAARLQQYGPQIASLVNQAVGSGVTCDPAFAMLSARARQTLPHASLELVASALPSVKVAEAQSAAATLRLRVAQLSRLPSIAPYVAGEFSRQVPAADALGSFGGGVRGAFDFVAPRATLEIEAARAEQAAAERSAEGLRFSNGAALTALNAEIIALINNEAVQQESLKTTRELLKTLEAQRAIGQVDSLTFASAWLNATQTQLQMLDSWGGVDRASRELAAYSLWVDDAQVAEMP